MAKIDKTAKNGLRLAGIHKSKKYQILANIYHKQQFWGPFSKNIPKSFNKRFWLFLAIIWQKCVLYGPKPNEICLKYLKSSYFDVVEVIKQFG